MKPIVLTALLLGLLGLASAAAPPLRYEYTFETLEANMQDRVNYVAGQGWEVHDVVFTNMSGYLVCYRRALPQGTPRYSYAFSLATPAKAQAKADEATRSGWEIYRMVSCAGKLYCLCLRRVARPPAYSFESSVGADLAKRANEASRGGWEVLDVGFGDVSGYLLCYRKRPEDSPPSTYSFVTCKGSEVEAKANEGARNGWELLRLVACLQDVYCLCFRKTSGTPYSYAVERAAGRNIESKADAAVAQGWEVYTLAGAPAGDIDYEDVSDLLHSSLPYMLCYRR